MRRAVNFFFYFVVLCALLGVGVWMLTDGNYVFGTLVTAAGVWQGVRLVKLMQNDGEER